MHPKDTAGGGVSDSGEIDCSKPGWMLQVAIACRSERQVHLRNFSSTPINLGYLKALSWQEPLHINIEDDRVTLTHREVQLAPLSHWNQTLK
jgi:hypothetical protein